MRAVFAMFARIFSPTRFADEVRLRWFLRQPGGWTLQDAIPPLLDLLMTDYGIKPYSAAGGTIKVKDEVVVNFNIVAKAG